MPITHEHMRKVLQETRRKILRDDKVTFTTGAAVGLGGDPTLPSAGPPTPVTYVYGLGLISATDASGQTEYFLPDALGSTMGTVILSTEQIDDSYTYDAFGNATSGATDRQTFLYTGQQYDAKAHGPSAGLYYMRARFYDPAIGRFINADPLEGAPSAPQSQNRYAYALNNATNRVDPTGLDSEGSGGSGLGSPLTLNCLSFVLTAAVFALAVTGAFGPFGPLVALPFVIGNFAISAGTGDLFGTTSNILGGFGATFSIAQGASVARFGGGLLALSLVYNAATCLQDVVPGDA